VIQLNLGLDSVVFIDDNPVERARVRGAPPPGLVTQWPTDKLLYEKALKELTCFDTATISSEDRARTAMYVSERLRGEARGTSQSLDEHLASLGLNVRSEPLSSSNVQRAVQLLNKTNQMNLTTRRMTELEFRSWAGQAGHSVFVFRVADRFGDHGLTGLASLSIKGADAYIADFVLSCRVLGRGVEEAMLRCLAESARVRGSERLIAVCHPTPRNQPCQTFFRTVSGFTASDDTSFTCSLLSPFPLPTHVTLEAPVELVSAESST
jgi:FkbH-like protein